MHVLRPGPLRTEAGIEGVTPADCENSSRRHFCCFKFYNTHSHLGQYALLGGSQLQAGKRVRRCPLETVNAGRIHNYLEHDFTGLLTLNLYGWFS